ncbi:MAG: PKD domain-containing protein, partial [Thermoplasmata archaeon]|nr:PKD domain-containing protein [Thermoplasmata archaeon]
HSVNIELNESVDLYKENITLSEEPSAREGSYRIMGFVKSGDLFVPDLIPYLWDVNNGHLVPIESDEDGAITLPAYDSIFRLIIEAPGYDPIWRDDIDLVANTYYGGLETTFEMSEVLKEEMRLTTIDLSGDITNPMIDTHWVLDANSNLYGFYNDFGNPRMQISDMFFSPGWNVVDEDDATMVEEALVSYGPAWLTTDDFLSVNDMGYSWNGTYTVDASGLEGSVFNTTHPVLDMTAHYEMVDDTDFKEGDDITVDIKELLDNEEIKVILPENYEVQGNFDEDMLEFAYGNAYEVLVKAPIEFTAKEAEGPEASLVILNAYEFYQVAVEDEEEVLKFIVGTEVNITLSAKGSRDPVGEIESYEWNIPANAVVITPEDEVDLSTFDEITVQFTNNRNSYHEITVTVRDRSDKADTASIMILPDSADPTIDDYSVIYEESEENVTYDGGYEVKEDLTLVFNASTAMDNGEIVDYIWVFGEDAYPLNGEVVFHAFSDPGQYNISLTLVDGAGNEYQFNRSANVSDTTDPMAVIKPFGEIMQGDEVELNGTQSYDPRTTGSLYEEMVSYEWTFVYDDEEQNVTLSGEVVYFTFEIPGDYLINLTVEDASGLTRWVEKPLLVLGPDLGVRGITFDPDENDDDFMEGEDVKIIIAYANDGLVDFNSTFTIRVEDNGKKIKEVEITPDAPIKAGDVVYYNFTYTLEKGSRLFKVYLDYNEDIPEQNEQNNEFEQTATVIGEGTIWHWWMLLILLGVILVIYVAYMKYTRGEWGYEPVVEWWNKRNA